MTITVPTPAVQLDGAHPAWCSQDSDQSDPIPGTPTHWSATNVILRDEDGAAALEVFLEQRADEDGSRIVLDAMFTNSLTLGEASTLATVLGALVSAGRRSETRTTPA